MTNTINLESELESEKNSKSSRVPFILSSLACLGTGLYCGANNINFGDIRTLGINDLKMMSTVASSSIQSITALFSFGKEYYKKADIQLEDYRGPTVMPLGFFSGVALNAIGYGIG